MNKKIKLPSKRLLELLLGQAHLIVTLERWQQIRAKAQEIDDPDQQLKFEIDQYVELLGDDHPTAAKMLDCYLARAIALRKFNDRGKE